MKFPPKFVSINPEILSVLVLKKILENGWTSGIVIKRSVAREMILPFVFCEMKTMKYSMMKINMSERSIDAKIKMLRPQMMSVRNEMEERDSLNL